LPKHLSNQETMLLVPENNVTKRIWEESLSQKIMRIKIEQIWRCISYSCLYAYLLFRNIYSA